MRPRTLLASLALAASLLVPTAAPAAAAPVTPKADCSLSVTDLYIAIAMWNANAKLSGGCTGTVDMTLEWSSSPSGPWVEDPDSVYYVQQYTDGTGAHAYYTDPAQRGYCRAKATFGELVAVSPNPTNC